MTDSHPIVIEFFHDCLSAWCYKASERLRAFAAAHADVHMVQRCYPLAVSPMLFNRQLYTDKREAKAASRRVEGRMCTALVDQRATGASPRTPTQDTTMPKMTSQARSGRRSMSTAVATPSRSEK